ncbi:hypothetical protein [Clostridium tagluense]|uniref:hypothetical protein n=1 Tax=Clostridium tagluense TaxID=360422 RepID=UPI001CF3548F|nr:hypothetical protein [Clostridium tagluense]MCB2300421.1 hypothetical protein [Clostridium tagluense]
MGAFKDLTGKVFGRLTVIKATKERKQGAVVWECKCECGNETYVSRSNLEQGNTLSCGCLQAENVAKRSKLRQTKNITGQKFGKLNAIEPTGKRDNGYIVWKCKCECGKENIYVNLHNLTSKNTLSCGCLNAEIAKENAVKNISKFKEENYVAGTRLDIIDNKKINKNNTTGYKGVYFRRKDSKHIAHIEFQGKRYFLGSGTKEEAIILRKEAESKLHGDFLKWYYEQKEKKNETK